MIDMQVYIILLFLLLMGVLTYYSLVNFEWDEGERRRLEKAELNLSIILRLIDAPDVKILMQNPRARRYLFTEYSRSLKNDVFSLIRSRELAFTTIAYIAVFFLVYLLVRLKAVLLCNVNDLRLLSSLELAIFRSLPE